MIEKIAEKYADSVPDKTLVKYEYAAFPVYKLHLNVTLLKKKEIGIIEEFIMKLIDAEIIDIDSISKVLGIEEILVNSAVANLFQEDLINFSQGNLKITDKGLNVLRDSKLIVPVQASYHLLVDAMTGEIFPNKTLFTQKEVKQKKFHTLSAYVNTPKIEQLDFNRVSRLVRQQQKDSYDDAFEGDLISINEIEKSYTMYKKRNLLVFTDGNTVDNKLDIKVFDGYDREVQYENIILKMEQDGIRQIPFDVKDNLDEKQENDTLISKVPREVVFSAKETSKQTKYLKQKEASLTQQLLDKEESIKETELISNEDKITATQEIKILKKQLNDLHSKRESSNRLLQTYEHRPLLEKSLKDAKKFVLIVSPWIRFSGFDNELQNSIRKTLEKGVQVIIGYGIAENDEGDERAIQKLKDMKKNKHGKNLTLVKLANTHEKVLLVDGKYVVITSFNWLSFRGNPKWGFRQETGLYTEDEKTILDVIDSLEDRMNLNIKKYIS